MTKQEKASEAALDLGFPTSRTQLALFLSLAVFTTGQSLLLVVLPPLGRRLGFSDIHIGGILSLSALLMMVSAPAWGYLSERIGRRPVLLTALVGAALGSIGFGIIIYFRLSGALSVFLALTLLALVRATQTLITSGILPAAQAYMADNHSSAAGQWHGHPRSSNWCWRHRWSSSRLAGCRSQSSLGFRCHRDAGHRCVVEHPPAGQRTCPHGLNKDFRCQPASWPDMAVPGDHAGVDFRLQHPAAGDGASPAGLVRLHG